MATIRPARAWAVIYPLNAGGYAIDYLSLSSTRRDCIAGARKPYRRIKRRGVWVDADSREVWPWLYRTGHRCVRVEVRAIEEARRELR